MAGSLALVGANGSSAAAAAGHNSAVLFDGTRLTMLQPVPINEIA